MGERPPIALISPAASARMAVAEALTNLVATSIAHLSDVKLSANWMAAAADNDQALALFEGVKAIGLELCPALGIAIPVGKDSLSMQTKWGEKQVVSPMTLVISAFAPVTDVRKTWTPLLESNVREAGELFLIDLGQGQNRLGGSILAQVYQQIGDTCPDVDDSQAIERLKQFWQAMQALHQYDGEHDKEIVQAYHDRSDGGAIVSLLEMAFASRCGLDIDTHTIADDDSMSSQLAALFNEELGAVIQVKRGQSGQFLEVMQQFGLAQHTHAIARVTQASRLRISYQGKNLSQKPLTYWLRLWAETSYRMQALRDNPESALQEYDALLKDKDPGLSPNILFTIQKPLCAEQRPRIAILREQGVNGQLEMAAAFTAAGFEAVDVHMTDLMHARQKLTDFDGVVACGGFSFGDVLGAGSGWAKNILLSPALAGQFKDFFADTSKFALGVCNGCQMLSQLAPLIPGATHWPTFVRNQSEQFEARLSVVKVAPSPSIFLKGMAGSSLLISSAHGEGRALFSENTVADNAQVCLQYVDNHRAPTTEYPLNPNGSSGGITGLVNDDGRIMIMMPHPERVFRQVLHSWSPVSNTEDGPWMQMFYNAYDWIQAQR